MPYTQLANLDFADIKSSLIDYLRANSDFTDYDFSGSTLSTMLDVLAYNTYYTAFNTNMVINEMFLDSASLRDNVVSLAKQIGYRPRSVTAPIAKLDLSLTYQGGATPPSTIVLKRGTGFTSAFDDAIYQFVVVDDHEVPLNGNLASFGIVDAYEGTLIKQSYTINTALKNQKFILNNPGLDTSTIKIRVYETENSTSYETYDVAENILDLDGNSKVFFVEEGLDEQYELFFGDGVYGKKLEHNNFVEVTYVVTDGESANGAKSFSFSGIVTTKTGSQFQFSPTVTTSAAAQGGADIESVSSIKYSAPKMFAAQDRAVTGDDYASIVRKIYPATSDIITFGGEQDDPPEFGKVKIAIKPQVGNNISAFTKQEIVRKLKSYTVASITPEIIDPSILYIELDSTVSYKSSKTTETKAEISKKVTTAVDEYTASSQTEKFDGRFRHSRYAAVIDGADPSIVSNVTNVTLRKDFYPTLNSTFYYELCFLNEFKDSCDNSVMKSTGFVISEYPTFTVYLEDDTFGKIDLYRLNSLTGEKVYVQKEVGEIDYAKGEIKLYNLTIISGSYSDNKIEIRVEPASKDVNAMREVYLDVDISKSNFSAVAE